MTNKPVLTPDEHALENSHVRVPIVDWIAAEANALIAKFFTDCMFNSDPQTLEDAISRLARHTALRMMSDRPPEDDKLAEGDIHVLTEQLRDLLDNGFGSTEDMQGILQLFTDANVDRDVAERAVAKLAHTAVQSVEVVATEPRSTFDYDWLQQLWCTLMDAGNNVNCAPNGDSFAQRHIKAALVQVEEAKQTWPEPADKRITFIDDVVKYQLAAGRTADSFNVRQLALHTGFQASEFSEKLDALCKAGLGTIRGAEMFTLYNVTTQLKYLSKHLQDGDLDFLFSNADVLELLDGDIDVMVVSIASMMSQGVDMAGAFREVMRSQYAKMTDGKLQFHPDGKIKKPQGWTPPDLAPFLYGPLRERILDQRARLEASTAEVEQIEAQRQRELAALNQGNKNQ